jgi:hypothetical protein
MDMVETVVLRESWDVDPRLKGMQLHRKGLLVARDVAIHESGNATAFHPTNAPGTFSYHHGTWAIRDQFVGPDWVVDQVDGIEAIRNEKLKIKIVFSNVDMACNDAHVPQPRSKKGAGSERASGTDLFGEIRHFAPRPTGAYALYYLMVDADGACELTRPILSGGTFVAAVERLYLSFGMDDDGAVLTENKNGPVDNFDPQVIRK